MAAVSRELAALADAHGVQRSYVGLDEERHRASREGLIAVLRALGAPIASAADAAASAALRAHRTEAWSRGIEPVHVAWNGRPRTVELRLPAAAAAERALVEVTLEGESTAATRIEIALRRAPTLEAESVEGERRVVKAIELPHAAPDAPALPPGRHRLAVEVGGRRLASLLLSAPRRAPAPVESSRGWGVFLPLYALRSRRDWGVGSLTELGELADWTARSGGRLVGTLPLLAGFLDRPLSYAPYAPVSRRFWNEVFVDVEAVPDLADSPAARAMLASGELRAELAALRRRRRVDYARVQALKRRVLGELARGVEAAGGQRARAWRGFLRERPEVHDYARFRAVTEARGATWPSWPQRLREGRLLASDADPGAERYHRYAQWIAHEQMDALGRRLRGAGAALYLDLPIGVHPDGYDVFRERALHVRGLSVGAPPDPFFSGGQDWGFPPLHPELTRADGHRHFAEVLRHNLGPAGILRIDHVMGLHRLYLVPDGLGAREGVYVRYPHEELYAVLLLEAHRAGSAIVGEDLGTVPAAVRAAMDRHGLRRMYVGQFDVDPKQSPPVSAPPRASLASLNTHDTPTFAGFWEARDVLDRERLGLLDASGARAERRARDAQRKALVRYLQRMGLLGRTSRTHDVLVAWLRLLRASEAGDVLVSLEDAWLEPEPQNRPGTTDERPNWQRRARLSLEALRTRPEVLDTLRAVEST
jgi:4-alpha-glucanotransferase